MSVPTAEPLIEQGLCMAWVALIVHHEGERNAKEFLILFQTQLSGGGLARFEATLFHYLVERPHLVACRYEEGQRIGKIFLRLCRGLALRGDIEDWTAGNNRSRSLVNLYRDFQFEIKQRPHESHPFIFSYYK